MGLSRRTRLRVAAGIGLALIGLAVVVMVAGSLLGPRLTRDHIEAALGAALGRPVRVGAVRLQPWLARLSLDDLELIGAPGPDGIARLRLPRADVSLAVQSLWRRQVVLSVHLHGLDLAMEVTPDSTSRRSPFPLPEAFALGPIEARIAAVRASEARIEVTDPRRGLQLDASGADIVARPAGGDLDVEGVIEMFRVKGGGLREEVARVSAAGRLAADRIDVRRLAWRWQNAPMAVEGHLRDPWGDNLALALRASGDLPLAGLARSVRLDAAADGTARIVASAEGPLSAPRVAVRASAAEMTLAGLALRAVSLDSRWEAGSLRLDGMEARLGTGRVAARAVVEPLPGPSTRVSVEVTELTLPAPLGGLRGGTGAIEVRWAQGIVELSRARIAWPTAALALDGRVDAAGLLAGRVSVGADLTALAGASALRPLAGRLELRGQLAGRLAAPELDGRVDIGGLVVTGRSLDPVEARVRVASTRPPGQPPGWNLVLDSPRIATAALAVEDLAATLSFHATGLNVVDARARAAGVPLRGSGTWAWGGDGRGKVAVGPAALDRVAGVPPALDLAGSVRGEADVGFAGGQATLAGALQLDRLSTAGIGLGPGRLDIRLRGPALVAELALPARKLRVEARGQLAAGGVIGARLEMGDLGLKELLAEWSPRAADLVAGRVSARGELSIPFDQPGAAAGSAQIEPVGLVFLGDTWTSRGPIALRWQRGDLVLGALRLEGPAGTLTGAGTLAGATSAQLSLALDNARLPAPLAAAGRGIARAEIRAVGREFELVRLDGQWPGLALSATGRGGANGLAGLRGRLSMELAPLSQAIGAGPLAGEATAVVEARGAWNALQATASVRAPALEMRGARVSDIEIPLRLERNVLRIDAARARIGSSRVTADVTASWPQGMPAPGPALLHDARFTAQAQAPALRIEDLDPLLPAAARGRGEVAITARAEGTGRAWRGTATIAASRADLAAAALRQVNAALAFDASRIEATDLRAEVGGLPVRGTGSWAWAGGGRASAAFGPGNLAGLGPPSLDLAGTGRGSVELTARSGPGLAIDGTGQATLEGLAVSGLVLGRGRVDLALRDGGFRATVGLPDRQLSATARGSIGAGGAIQLAAAEVSAREGTLTAAGTIGPSTVDVRAQGRLPLDALASMRPEIRDAGGMLELSLRATGAIGAPVLSGEGAVRGGRLLLRDRPETLRDIEARFGVSSQGIQLREATAAMGSGRLQARGDLALEGRAIGAYRVHLTARGVSLATIEGLSSAWDADLDLSGLGGDAWLQGGARLVRGVYTRDLSLLSLALSRSRPEAAAENGGRLHLQVRLRLDDNLAVRTRTADLRAGGALTVQGTTGDPVVFGAIESRDGRIVFRGHDFSVTSASVRFADPRAVDPLLDVIATSRIREYDVTVQLSGRLSDLSVRLSSVPRLPPDDLLALVSLGATRAELQSSPASVLLGETGRALAQSLLGIDPTTSGLRVSVVSSTDGQGDPYRVWEDERDRSAGARRTSDRREKLRVEYRLLDPVYLSGEYNPEGGYGADIIFRLRFR